MKVTTKGQVTIPLELRKKAGILPGSEVEFYESGGKLHLRKVRGPRRGERLVERMTGQGAIHMSTDEILALTRGND